MREELTKRDADLAAELEKAQSVQEELVKKDEDLASKASTINQLRNLGRRYKTQSAENETKFKKVRNMEFIFDATFDDQSNVSAMAPGIQSSKLTLR